MSTRTSFPSLPARPADRTAGALPRRALLRAAGAAASLAPWLGGAALWTARPAMAARRARFKLGVTDWNLKLAGQPEAVLMAAKLQFDGLQVSVGRFPKDGKLPLSDKMLQQTYLTEAKRHKCKLASLCLDILNVNGLKWREDPLGPRWVNEAIPIAKALGMRVILLPFFGKHKLENQGEIEYVGDVLKEIAPAAARAGVVLGLENTLSAEDNLRLLERTRSRSLSVYYDVGNATKAGFNVVDELRLLAKESRLCEVQLKDNPSYLGEGSIDIPAIVEVLATAGFQRWVQLETDSPSGDVQADMARNQAYVRRLMSGRRA